MSLDGVGGNSSVNNNNGGYRLDTARYGQDSWQASIFNAIDASDGNVTGELTQEQYKRFQEKVLTEGRVRLEARLNDLNTKAAKNRFEGDDERFGNDGIASILEYANSIDNIESINQMLDRLENGEDIWTFDIVNKFEKKQNPLSTGLGGMFGGFGFGNMFSGLGMSMFNPKKEE